MTGGRTVGRRALADRRRWAWGLVAGVLGSWLLAVLLVTLGVVPGASGTGTVVGETDGEQVLVVGVPGLTWDLVSPGSTPVLDRLAREGAAGALVLRGTHEVTCAADAWLTLGAGQRASTNVEGCVDAEFEATPYNDRPAPVYAEEVVGPDGDGAVVLAGQWDAWTAGAARRALGPELGTLARLLDEAGTCAAAHDPLAALGAADPGGRVAAYPEGGWPLSAGLDGDCRVHLVSTPAAGAGLTEVDAALGRLVEELPDGVSLVVAGLGHTTGRAEATVVLVRPADGGPAAVLSSGSTRQEGLVQLTDLTPTVLRLAGVEVGSDALAGEPVVVQVDAGTVEDVRGLASGISGAKRLAPWVLGATGVLVAGLLGAALVLRRRRLGAVVATFATAVPVATFLAGLVPWWGTSSPGVVLTVVVVVGAALVTGVAGAGPWRRDPLGPAALVAAVSLAVLGADVICSARLGLVSVLGLQPVTAGRFYGQGNVGFGVVLGSFVVLASAVVTWLGGGSGVARRARLEAAAAVVVLGLATTAVNAAPQAGADFGGVPALVVATGLVALAAAGVAWSARVVAGLALASVVVAGGVMVADWARGPERRTHLGGFVQSVLDGEALGIVGRKLAQSVGILVSFPASWLAVVALVLVALVVWRRPAWSARLWTGAGAHPAAWAGVVASVLVWVLNDSGVAAMAMTLTMLIGTALTVLWPPHDASGGA